MPKSIPFLWTEFLTVTMMLLVVIIFQFSFLKGISVEKQLDVKRREREECKGIKNNVGCATDFQN